MKGRRSPVGARRFTVTNITRPRSMAITMPIVEAMENVLPRHFLHGTKELGR